MSSIPLTPQPVPAIAAPDWLDYLDTLYSAEQVALVRQAAAAAMAYGALPGERRRAERDLAAGKLLFDVHMDDETVSAVMLLGLAQRYPAYRASALAADSKRPGEVSEWLRSEYGPEVERLVMNTLKTGQIGALSEMGAGAGQTQGARLEALRKMVLAMADDVRVVLMMLAERTCLMRSLASEPQDMQRTVARQTMDLFAPLANRLGMGQLKWELEDLSFRFLQPELYRQIDQRLNEQQDERERFIREFVVVLSRELKAAGIEAEVAGRPKHLYSIYRKMQRKHADFDTIYDVRAVRVLVKEVKDCYAVLGLVHHLWEPVSGEFDDYIAKPKGNNYRSLHTAVMAQPGKALEVQIRTFDMHQDAELGIAAHWRYKEGKAEGGRAAERKFDEKIAWLRQVLDWKRELAEAAVVPEEIKHGLFEDTVYVLTPQGRVIDLPAGATPLDFAYHVHTELGHRCRGAKVDGAIVPLTYRLQNAQRVEIISAKQGSPSRDWLNPALGYLHSPRALAKVRQWFKLQFHEQEVAQGRALLEREMQRLGSTGYNQEKLSQLLGHKSADDMLAAIGRGEITPRQIDLVIQAQSVAAVPLAEQPAAKLTAPTQASAAASGILVLGVNNIATVLAKCCKPVPPEPVMGFVTKTRGVTVHRADCRNLIGLTAEQSQRLMVATWGDTGAKPFSVDVEVVAADRQGLLRDISEAISRERTNVTAVNTQSRANQAYMKFTIEVSSLDWLARVLKQITEVPGVIGVARK